VCVCVCMCVCVYVCMYVCVYAGLNELWRITMDCPSESVAKRAITFLIRLHTQLSAQLKSRVCVCVCV